MRVLLLLALLLIYTGCDHGLEPPDAPLVGSIRGTVTYVGAWPPSDSLRDLRFVALPFVPRDTLDLFRCLSQLVFSERLAYNIQADTFFVDSVQAQLYVYSGVAQKFSQNLFDWRPVGLADLFQVRPGEVTELSIRVDFDNIPPFPPGNENMVTQPCGLSGVGSRTSPQRSAMISPRRIPV